MSLLEDLVERGEADAFDVALARSLAAPLPSAETELGLFGASLIARLSAALSRGDTCLEGLAHFVRVDSDSRLEWSVLRDVWHAEGLLARAGEVGDGTHASSSAPLVLDEAERLYLRRYFVHERRLGMSLARRLRGGMASESSEASAVLARFFPEDADPLQRAAARATLRSSFSVITGGPGTGKTTTVARILATLVALACERGEPAPEVLLLAPTGKAATRLRESLSAASAHLGLRPAELAAFPSTASTIHRALGVLPDNPTRFRRDAESPLPHDVVIVDEASMIDVRLMDALLSAIPETSKLVLLGDVHQLASVDAGCVLGEVARTMRGRGESFVELERSYRFSETSAIHRLASAVKRGALSEARAALDGREVRVFELEPTARELPGFWEWVVEGYRPALAASSPREALDALANFRVLLAHRKGALGVEVMNRAIRAALSKEDLCPSGAEAFAGLPLLVTENDPVTRLSNGDVGVVFPDEGGRLAAFFDEGNGAVRRVSLAELPAYEEAFAMTIHKSQGSEYGEVAIVLPDARSPLLGRELLYTALTRAKRRIALWSSTASFERAVSEAVTRTSGLRSTLERCLEE